VIASLTGVVTALGPTAAVLDVGGVGFKLLCPPTTAASLRLGERATLLTHLAVRQDDLTLYGFARPDDREAFLLVQTAAGVGPKLALSILAVMDAPALARAVAASDLAALVKIPGVGKKVAERLVVELRDKVAALAAPAVDQVDDDGAARRSDEERRRGQVVAGLTGLGYAAKEAERAVAAAADQADQAEQMGQAGPADRSVAAYMRAALKQLAR
jgi:Holliday junction DNA helicase RuvA